MSWSFGVPERGRFVALRKDGLGADAHGNECLPAWVTDAALVSWFVDAGFAFWLPLPDRMQLFFEGVV